MITLSALTGGKFVRHAFFTRQGGISDGLFTSLNCGFGSGDDRGNVAHNRATAAAQLGVAPQSLVTCHQIHGVEVVTVNRPWDYAEAPRADAMVTRTPGIGLGVLAADCAPVLFSDPEAKVVGAAHGGWHGTLAGVMEATRAPMIRPPPPPAAFPPATRPFYAHPSHPARPEFLRRL